MAAGYGMPAIFTPAGVGTEVAKEKKCENFNGKKYLWNMLLMQIMHCKSMERRYMGNLIYKETARNFNPLMAMAGRITIAEVEELVDPRRTGSGSYSYARHLCSQNF